MKHIIFIFFMLFFVAAQSIAQRIFTILPLDSTYQLKIEEKGSRSSENAFLSREMDTLTFRRHIFGQAWDAESKLAKVEVQSFINDRERNRIKKLYNTDLALTYFDSSAYLMYPRLSGIWRLKVDTLIEKVEVYKAGNGVLKIKTIDGYASVLNPPGGINSRINCFSNNKIEIKSLLGIDQIIYGSDMFQQREQDEGFDSEVEELSSQSGEKEYYRYISIPSEGRKVVFKKLKHIDIE